jgi:hypothetical protein
MKYSSVPRENAIDPNQQQEPVFVGVNIASGCAYLGVCCGSEVLVGDGADLVMPNSQLTDGLRLEDFRARLSQELRRLHPRAVGIARARKYNNWTMANATTRFGLEAAVLLAAVQEGFDGRIVTQEEAARGVGVPVTKIADKLPGCLGIEPTPHWNERATAFLIARHLAGAES